MTSPVLRVEKRVISPQPAWCSPIFFFVLKEFICIFSTFRKSRETTGKNGGERKKQKWTRQELRGGNPWSHAGVVIPLHQVPWAMLRQRIAPPWLALFRCNMREQTTNKQQTEHEGHVHVRQVPIVVSELLFVYCAALFPHFSVPLYPGWYQKQSVYFLYYWNHFRSKIDSHWLFVMFFCCCCSE